MALNKGDGKLSPMVPIYLIVGVAGAGKSWVCRQLKDKFKYVAHDACWEHPRLKPPEDTSVDTKWPDGAKSTHLQVLVREASGGAKPIITEIPFGERPMKEALEACGIEVKPYFVIEQPHVVVTRYRQREKKDCPMNVRTRATTILSRALEWGSPHGTSEEILRILTELPI